MARYSTTVAGKVNYVLTEYINGMHTIVDQFKDRVIKTYNLVHDSFGPFSRIDDLAEESKAISNELEQTEGIDNETQEFVDKSKKLFAAMEKEFEIIKECNHKTQYMEGEIKTDIREELGEFKDYIEDLFLSMRCPHRYDDALFGKRIPGVLNKQKEEKVVQKQKKDKGKKGFKDNYKMEDDDCAVNMYQDFDIVEGRAFKGHAAPIRDLIKIGNSQFGTCDENGMIVIWSKVRNQ